jgi:ACS family D-galactonate transporter-like MFS transporter
MGGASFIAFLSGFVGELVGGFISDQWKASGGSLNRVMRTRFSISARVSPVALVRARL